MVRLLAFIVLAVAWTQSALPVYTPKHLRPISWPPDSPGPEFHSGDFAGAVEIIQGHRVGIRRAAVSWGTGVLDEWYSVFALPTAVPAESVAVRSGVGDSLWSGRSYLDDCASCATGDSTRQDLSVGGCLFIADDSLLAYGVVRDNGSDSPAWAERSTANAQPGFYRPTRDGRGFVRVARASPDFNHVCRAQLGREGRTIKAR